MRVFDRHPGAVEFWTSTIAAHTAGASDTITWQSEPVHTWTLLRFVEP